MINKNLDKLKSDIEKLNNKTIKVGIFKEDTSEEVLQRAFTNEYGTIKTPRRSFIREPINRNINEIKQKYQEQVKEVLIKRKLSIELVTNRIGIAMKAIILRAFATAGFGKWKSLSKLTIAKKKGKGNILIDTGSMRDAVNYKITNNK